MICYDDNETIKLYNEYGYNYATYTTYDVQEMIRLTDGSIVTLEDQKHKDEKVPKLRVRKQ